MVVMVVAVVVVVVAVAAFVVLESAFIIGPFMIARWAVCWGILCY